MHTPVPGISAGPGRFRCQDQLARISSEGFT